MRPGPKISLYCNCNCFTLRYSIRLRRRAFPACYWRTIQCGQFPKHLPLCKSPHDRAVQSHGSAQPGDRPKLATHTQHARGSHALAQLSDACIAIQVDPEEPDSDIRHLRILKNRFTGETGDAGTLVYDRETGRLIEEELSHLLTEAIENKETAEDGDD